ncbi:hypothetical protein [Streptomyces omiyaensis]|uniref:hypothetical protein n=1 Tax=Streptomyces omiyaensis TaxID=68247 RepID=UPI0036FCE24F
MPGWTRSDVPGLPLAGYGYTSAVRIGPGWRTVHAERSLALGGPAPAQLEFDAPPRTVEEVVEAAAAQAADLTVLTGREDWLSAAASAFGAEREDWLRSGAGLHLVPTAVRVTAVSRVSGHTPAGDGHRIVVERELPEVPPPTRQEIEEYAATEIDAAHYPAGGEPPVPHLPVRTGPEPLPGPHLHFPGHRRPDPDHLEHTLGDEAALYDGAHRIAWVPITAATPDALDRAQRILAAELAPWTETMLRVEAAERLRPHSRQTPADQAAALTRAVAGLLPDAGRAPLPPLHRAWRHADDHFTRWRDVILQLLLTRWAPADSAGRDHLIRWSHHGTRAHLHTTSRIPMQAIHRALAARPGQDARTETTGE